MDKTLYYIFCDESCHLPKDNSDLMVLGAIFCREENKAEIYQDIRHIKEKHGINSKVEIKWTKISPAKVELYEELVDYFFKNPNLYFRGVIAKDKKALNHDKFNHGDQNEWYYKMYYLLLHVINNDNKYRVFIDVKDTNGGSRVSELERILRNRKRDFGKQIILDIRQVESSRSDLLQLTDILIGALSYYHRGLFDQENTSYAKKQVIRRIFNYSADGFKFGTSRKEKKFNTFIWQPNWPKRGEC